MCCFVVPLAQAIATTVVRRHNRENIENGTCNSFVKNLSKFELMLWGGSAMLIVDHIINGEVVPFWPFFTALNEEGGAMTMLSEMLTVGVPMSVIVTAVYSLMCLKPSWKYSAKK